MIDVDHFKPVNDDYGHDAGDRVLAQLGRLLLAGLRSTDQGVRWGGEEFMILLPETGAAGARETAERLRRAVAEARFEGPGRLTVSIGVACIVSGEARSALLKRLDEVLYRAKQGGRNRVEVAAQPGAGISSAVRRRGAPGERLFWPPAKWGMIIDFKPRPGMCRRGRSALGRRARRRLRWPVSRLPPAGRRAAPPMHGRQ